MEYFNINTLNPYVRIAWCDFDSPQKIRGPRLSFDYEIIHVNFGHVVVHMNDKEYSFDSGDFIFIPPNVMHSINTTETNTNYAYLHFDMVYSPQSHLRPTTVKQISLPKADMRLVHDNILEGIYSQPTIHFNDYKTAKKLYFGITRDNALSSRSSKDDIEVKQLLIKLINMLLKDNYPEFFARCIQPDLPIAQAIKKYIDEGNHGDTLADLERIFSFNRFHMERQFKKAYKKGIMEYKNIRRLETAHLLLKKNSVGKVAEQLGYSSVYAFSRAFKNHYGFNPSEVKKRK